MLPQGFFENGELAQSQFSKYKTPKYDKQWLGGPVERLEYLGWLEEHWLEKWLAEKSTRCQKTKLTKKLLIPASICKKSDCLTQN